MNFIKRIIREIVYVLKSIYEVLFIYPKNRYEELGTFLRENKSN